MTSCPVCEKRKGKRPCPAKAAEICSHCCGTKRLKEIACPSDCVFLTGAHAASWEGRETERRRDTLRVAPFLSELTDGQSRLAFVSLIGVMSLRAERRDLDDHLLAEALTAFRKTIETRSRGLLYDHRPEDARAEGLIHALKDLFRAVDADGRETTPADEDLLPVVKALEAAVRHTISENLAPSAFLESMTRLLDRHAPPAPGRSLIVTP